MRIACIIASLRLGGAERQLAGLAVVLKEAGHDVEVVSYREGDFYSPVLDDAGVPHTRISAEGGDFKTVRRIAAHLIETRCELLISFLAGTNIKACMVKRRCPGLRLIVSERNCNRSLLPHDIYRFLLYRRAGTVVCNSYSQEAFISRRFPLLRSRLRTIPNFVDTVYFSPSVQTPQPNLDVQDRKEPEEISVIKILVTARLDKRKNALGLIQAAADCGCGNLRFDWYGAGKDDAYKRQCLDLIDKCGLGTRFFIHNAVEDVRSLYRRADYFCLPSFYEGTPNSLAEALSCALPAAVSDVSDNARYVEDGANGFLFNPRDVSTIASALRKISLTTASQRSESGRISRQKALDSFKKNIFAEKYLKLIGE